MKRILMTILGLAVAWCAVAQTNYTHYGEDEGGNDRVVLGKYTDPDTGKEYPRFVVMKDTKTGKLGIWQNARTEVNPATGERKKYSGEWVMAPKYDGLALLPSGIPEIAKFDCFALAQLRVGKGKSAKDKCGLVRATESNINGVELVPVKYDVVSIPDKSEQSLCRNILVGFGNYTDKDGNSLMDLWKVDRVREGSTEIAAVKVFSDVEEQFNDYRLIAVKKNGKWNMYDRNLTEILADDYDEMMFYKGGTIVYKLSNGLYGGILPKPRKMGENYTWIEEVTWELEKGSPITVVFAEREGVKYYVSSTEHLLRLWVYDTDGAAKLYSQDIVRMSYSNWYNKTVGELNAAYLKQGGDPAKWEEYLSSVMPEPGLKYFEAANSKLVLGDYDESREAFPLYLSSSPWNAVYVPIPKDQSAKFKEWFVNGEGHKYILENISYTLRFDTPAIEAIGLPDASSGERVVYKF